MHQGLVASLRASSALSAAQINFELKLPLTDRVILATARTYQGIVWTQDAHFKGLPGIRYTEKITSPR
jgi:hypothetical protein